MATRDAKGSEHNTTKTMEGRRVLVTGASAGIGRQAAEDLGRLGASLLLVGRSAERTAAAAAAARAAGAPEVEVALADLSSQRDLQRLAEALLPGLLAAGGLDVLVNNAGVALPERGESAEGIELTWATNVLAYHLLVERLEPALRKAAERRPARVINVASQYAGDLDLADVEFRRRAYDGNTAYRQSKQADRMLTWAQARHLAPAGILANAMHPGAVRTELLRTLMGGKNFGRTTAQGADTAVWLASSPELDAVTGRFFMDRRERPCEFRGQADEERLLSLCRTMTARAA